MNLITKLKNIWGLILLNESLYSKEKYDWETPDALFNKLDEEFHFFMDLCANEKNAKCKFYFTEKKNALIQEWTGTCWMNPPYGKGIDKWIEKAYSSSINNFATIVCLLPVRSDTKWWHKYCMKAEIRFLTKRLKFKESNNMATFPSAIVIFSKRSKLGMNISMNIS